MPDALSIPEERLRACLRAEYDLAVVALERLPLGLDTTASVYRAVSATGTPYLIKARSGPLYEASCLAPRYLADHGVAAVVAPLRTIRGALWADLDGQGTRVVAVYPFIAGESGWRPGLSDAQWRTTGRIVSEIHEVPSPPEGDATLRREAFDVGVYRRGMEAIDARLAQTESASPIERALRERWMEHRPTSVALVAAMETLAEALRRESGPLVICHADLHASNLIRDDRGGVFVVDWDDVMLAPKERDFLFVGDPAPDGSTQAGAPFFQGYGPSEIDWTALTYYRCERVVQDVIACGQDVVFRDDLGDDVRAGAVELLGDVFAAGGMVDAAASAAAHLPTRLSIP